MLLRGRCVKPRWIFVIVLVVFIAAIWVLWMFHVNTELAPIRVSAPKPIAQVDAPQPALDAVAKPDSVRERVHSEAARDEHSDATTISSSAKRLKVLVIDAATRAPLPGMRVEMHLGPAEQHLSDEDAKWLESEHSTGADGRVDYPRDVEGAVDVRAYDPDETLGSAVRSISSFADLHEDEITLELSPRNDVVFWMRIVDQNTHTPIAGAHDTRFASLSPVDPTHRFKTDASGLLFVRGPAWTSQPVQLDVPDHSMVFVQPVTGHEVPEKALEIEVWHSATVRALVLDMKGAPAVNARIQLETEPFRLWRPDPTLGWSAFTFPDWTRITDDAGRATFVDLPANVPVRVEVQSNPRWSPGTPLTLTPGETRDVLWNLRTGCRVGGRVIDHAGVPVARCEVWALKANMTNAIYFEAEAYGAPQHTARTDEQGRFTFPAVGAGKWWIGPGRVKQRAEGLVDDLAPFAQVVAIAETQTDAEVDLLVDRGLFVTGHVLAPAGKQVGKGVVVAQDMTRGGVMRTTWNEDGSFRTGPFMDCKLSVYAQSYSGLTDSETVEMQAGQSDVVLRLNLGASLSGRVVDEKGDPVGCRVLSGLRDEFGHSQQTIAEVPAGEEFEFTGLDAGTYDLAATTGDGKVGTLEALEVAEGTARHDLILRVVQGGRVRVRYEGSQDSGTVEVLVNGVPVSEGSIERGQATTFTAPAGKVLVRVQTWGADPIRERTVTVDVGVTTDVVIDYGAH